MKIRIINIHSVRSCEFFLQNFREVNKVTDHCFTE